MDKQQVYEALCAKCKELTYAAVKPINNDWFFVTYNCFGQIKFYVYLLANRENMPERNVVGYQSAPVVLFDGTNACIYALPFANGMWFCNQPIFRQFDNIFLAKIFSLLDYNTSDNKFLHTIEVAKADMPHVIVEYIRDYELAKAITNGCHNDVLDSIIVTALQNQQFHIVRHDVIPLHVPILKKNQIVNHLFGIYKKGWYNIAVLPQEQMRQPNIDIVEINRLLTTISLEIYYIPRYESGVEILPFPMTWSIEWTNKEIPDLQKLYTSTYKFLSSEI